MTEIVNGRHAEILRRNAVLVIVLLAVAASISGIGNGFAFDDVHVIRENDRVHSIVSFWRFFGQTYWPPSQGASLYRPLTILAFAIEWSIGRGSPLPFHVTSIVLYCLVCVILYRMLKLIVHSDVAFLASVLFAVHPVHTEAVANVVGQGELFAALFLFLGVERYLRARQNGELGWRDITVISALYVAGCMSKEHGIILPALLAAAEVVIVRGAEESRTAQVRRAFPLFASLLGVAVTFVVVRTLVTGGLRAAGINELLSGAPISVRVLTMLSIVVEWVRLLFWPAQLSADYSFPRTHIASEPSLSMLPGLLVIVGGAAAAWHIRRARPAVTFAALWIAVTMAIPSNLIMITGFVLAERTLFLASAGVTLVIAVAVVELWRAGEPSDLAVRRRLLAGAVGVLIACGISRSAIRNPVWRDNDTLFARTIEDTPFNSRAHWMLAEHLARTGRKKAGADEMLLAVLLGRKDDFVLLGFAADQLLTSGMCGRAAPLYHRALALTPQNEQLRANTSLCLMRLGRIDEARTIANAGLTINRKSAPLVRMLALADSLTGVRHKRAAYLR